MFLQPYNNVLLAVSIMALLLFLESYFGLSLKGKHNIYNMVLVKNSYLSAFLYLFGLGAVLLLGYGYNKLLNYAGNLVLKANGQWARSSMYSLANAGISSFLSGWY